jgi:hypothetical protein
VSLRSVLSQKRAAILDRWHRLVLDTYPAHTVKFMGRGKDPFGNPVGATLSRELPAVVDGLVNGAPVETVAASLEAVVRIRAVQDFTPSQALLFVYQLKRAIREELPGDPEKSGLASEWLDLCEQIDELALAAFDCYSANREKICDIRINEMKKRVFVMEKASRMFEEKDDGPESGGG